MSEKTYAQHMTDMPTGTPNGISAQDVRDIVDTYSPRRTLGTYTTASVATPTSFTTLPVTQFGTAITNGITWVGNYVQLRDNDILPFEIFYDLQGELSVSDVVETQLIYGLAGAAPTLVLPQSGFITEPATSRKFTAFKRYEIPAAGANTTIALQYKTGTSRTWTNAAVFVSVRSLPPNYGGA
jgi:hypothetical protein